MLLFIMTEAYVEKWVYSLTNKGAAHVSPLGGYNEESDMFLLMDVSRYKYPVGWIRYYLI
jgi:hypothetical protein